MNVDEVNKNQHRLAKLTSGLSDVTHDAIRLTSNAAIGHTAAFLDWRLFVHHRLTSPVRASKSSAGSLTSSKEFFLFLMERRRCRVSVGKRKGEPRQSGLNGLTGR